MRLTTQADLALRLLLLLALKPDVVHSVEETAARYRIPRERLTKVSRELMRAGLVENLRDGGIRLARPAHHINLGAVLRATDEDSAWAGYFGETWHALYFVLEHYSLADLLSGSEISRQIYVTPSPTMH
jgi:Rrf2 family protein